MKKRLLIFLTLLLSHGLFGAPLPNGGEAPASAKYNELQSELLGTLLEEYRKLSKDSQPIQKKFITLFENYRQTRCLFKGFRSWRELNSDAIDFLSLKPQDPFSLAIVSLILMEGAQDKDGSVLKLFIENAVKADKEIALAGYSVFGRLMAAKAHAKTLKRSSMYSQRAILNVNKKYANILATWMLNNKLGVNFQRHVYAQAAEFFENLTELKIFDEFHQRMESKTEKLSPWMAAMLKGHYYKRTAMHRKSRCSPFCYKAKCWRSYEREMLSSSDYFQTAWALNPQAPESATQTTYYTGSTEAGLARPAWYERNSNKTTHEVGAKLGNAFGLYDMHGNVSEWWHDNGWDFDRSSARVFRGGCWSDDAEYCGSASCGWSAGSAPNSRGSDLGLRLVLSQSVKK